MLGIRGSRFPAGLNAWFGAEWRGPALETSTANSNPWPPPDICAPLETSSRVSTTGRLTDLALGPDRVIVAMVVDLAYQSANVPT